MSSSSVIGFQEIDATKVSLTGGKGANLGELSKIDGIRVPEGFCVTTAAYTEMIGHIPEFDALLEQLSLLTTGDTTKIRTISKKIRDAIEAAAIAKDVQEAIVRHIATLGEHDAYAVRSSATAEDLPTASFAGQQDTYLNVIGMESILTHVSKCWASLFTERAVLYRIQNGVDHRGVSLSVIIQTMIFPQAAGILFTADPVTGNRKIVSIDASFGLGEALVSGLVNADTYKVRDGEVIEKKISAKTLAISAVKKGGTTQEKIAPDRQNEQTLTDEQILELTTIGRTIEAHFGKPQDIEWCLADNVFSIVQSRPITTLFPIPDTNDRANHVYISVGHQQMMTDAMKPLGISLWQLTAGRPMSTAGGRLFVDVAKDLASLAGRHMMVNVLGKSDPLIRDALTTILEREDFIKTVPDEPKAPPPRNFQTLQDLDPSIVSELIRKSESALEESRKIIQAAPEAELMDVILEDSVRLKKVMTDPQSFSVFMTAMNASAWINEHIQEWLGDKNVADTLSLSVPHNVTSEMGLALLDLADTIRPHADIVDYLQQVKTDDDFLDGLTRFEGGQDVQDAFRAYLETYGMRCAGEIDITRPRWSEKPTMLLSLILTNVRSFEPGESARRFERGKREAIKKEEDILTRLRQEPDGEQKVTETKRMIGLVRNFIGYREYPKYTMISRYFVYKQALMKEAQRLADAGVLQDKEDVFYLTFDEFRDAIRTQTVDQKNILKRREDYAFFQKLTPPRVMTSDGESITGKYKRENVPTGALVGLPVSSGMVEGRARVLLSMEDADIQEGDILVTPFTDPSWTPLFVSIKGLVTEVGGLMTHGAVIAREYGLPAVVGVENATRLIKDGQRIRVHGTEGYVEILG